MHRPPPISILRALAPAALALAPGLAHAGTLHPALEATLAAEPTGQRAVVAFLPQRTDALALVRRLRSEGLSRRDRHEIVVRRLRGDAEPQAPLLDQLGALEAEGRVERYRSFWIVNAVSFRATPDVIRLIAGRDDVDVVEPDVRLARPDPEEATSARRRTPGVAEPNLRAVRATDVWHELGFTGAGRLVAVVDSGVDGTHPALAARWRGTTTGTPESAWLDFLGSSPTFPEDLDGHGTRSMGTVCGLEVATADTIGVAWGADWIAANATAIGTMAEFDAAILTTLEWLADPDGDPVTVDDVPDAVGNSWSVKEEFGWPDCYGLWNDAIDNCEAAGVATFWSVSNRGPDPGTVASPAERAATPLSCFSVGSVLIDGGPPPYDVATSSARGPSGCDGVSIKPEVVAPGNVRSSSPGGGYGSASGTSRAVPHLPGTAALMREADPDITVEEIKTILLETAIDHGTPGDDNAYGMGLIDAYEAVVRAVQSGILNLRVEHAAYGYPVAGVTVEALGPPPAQFQTDLDGRVLEEVSVLTETVNVSHPAFEPQVFDDLVFTAGDTTSVLAELVPLDGDVTPPSVTASSECTVIPTGEVMTIEVSASDDSGVAWGDLHVSVGGEPFVTIPMALDETGTFRHDVTDLDSPTTVTFYASVIDPSGNTATSPPDAPASVHSFQTGTASVALQDDLETDGGWILGLFSDTATDGVWEIADPEQTMHGGEIAQPEDDHTADPGILCVVTGAAAEGDASANDVDNGCTTAITPVYDLSGAEGGRVRYRRHFYREPDGDPGDILRVEATTNGGTWTLLEEVSAAAPGWTDASFRLCGPIVPSATVLLRFTACDDDVDHVLEAAVDDVVFERFELVVGAEDGPAVAPRAGIRFVAPNPVAPRATVGYEVASAGDVDVSVYDVNGRHVATLFRGHQTPGRFEITWDGRAENRAPVASGRYFVRLRAADTIETATFVLLR